MGMNKMVFVAQLVAVSAVANIVSAVGFSTSTSQAYLSTLNIYQNIEAYATITEPVVEEKKLESLKENSANNILTEVATKYEPVVEEPQYPDFLDEKALFAKSNFPIKPDDLIARAKYVLSDDCGIGTEDNGECLAEDFEFCAAVVGPIGREEYLNALKSFKLKDAFDITPNYFGMSVDPTWANRVWFFSRVRGIHVGEFMGAKPTKKEILYPPQCFHLDFNKDGKVKEIGFYTSDRRQGNTGGLGGAFGFMYGVGKPLPIPECQPFKRSFRFRMLSFVGNFFNKLSNKN